jgi:hypothetical protein
MLMACAAVHALGARLRPDQQTPGGCWIAGPAPCLQASESRRRVLRAPGRSELRTRSRPASRLPEPPDHSYIGASGDGAAESGGPVTCGSFGARLHPLCSVARRSAVALRGVQEPCPFAVRALSLIRLLLAASRFRIRSVAATYTLSRGFPRIVPFALPTLAATCLAFVTVPADQGSASSRRVGSAGVSVALPDGWYDLPQAVPPRGIDVGDPLTRVVVAPSPVDFSARGCNEAGRHARLQLTFPPTELNSALRRQLASSRDRGSSAP